MAAQVEIVDQYGDQVWRLCNLYWCQNKDGKPFRFEPNWAQLQLLEELRQNHLILKVRQLGASTFLMLLGLDTAVFTPGFVGMTIAHDKESMRKLFRRNIRTPFDRLPDAIRENLEVRNNTAHELTLANGSSYSVALSARSDTIHYLHVSEFAKICAKYPLKAQEIVTGSFEAVPEANGIKAIESTAEGQHGYFYDYCMEALKAQQEGRALAAGDWSISFLPWWKHPEYVTSPRNVVIPKILREYFQRIEGLIGQKLGPARRAWYATKWKRLGDQMKQEYPSTPEEAFEQTLEGAFYSSEMTQVRLDGRIKELPHIRQYPVNTWWDLGLDDKTAIWFVQYVGPWYHVLHYLEGTGEGIQHYARRLAELRDENGWIWGEHVGPHDLKVREFGNEAKPRYQTAQELGLLFEICPDHGVADGIESVRNALGQVVFNSTDDVAAGIKALDSYRKEWDEVRGTYRRTPLHDWASDAADAFRIGIVGGKRKNRVKAQPPTRTRKIA